MNIGSIRVSRDKQTTALQEDAIQQAQCERVFTDKMSGVRLLKLFGESAAKASVRSLFAQPF